MIGYNTTHNSSLKLGEVCDMWKKRPQLCSKIARLFSKQLKLEKDKGRG